MPFKQMYQDVTDLTDRTRKLAVVFVRLTEKSLEVLTFRGF